MYKPLSNAQLSNQETQTKVLARQYPTHTELSLLALEQCRRANRLAEAAREVINAFKAIDDGFYIGLVPPEMVPILHALRAYEGREESE
jgi:hypothetical protein